MNTNSRILLVGKICGEDFSWTVSPLPVEEQLTDEEVNRIIDVEQCAPEDMIQATIDGDFQRSIDEGEMTAEYEDWLEDVEWMRRGGS